LLQVIGYLFRCNNIAAILELDENLKKSFKKFTAAPEDFKDPPIKKDLPEYFL
jgi:serine/threonine-protein phosphatase 4 catalytic subunit